MPDLIPQAQFEAQDKTAREQYQALGQEISRYQKLQQGIDPTNVGNVLDQAAAAGFARHGPSGPDRPSLEMFEPYKRHWGDYYEWRRTSEDAPAMASQLSGFLSGKISDLTKQQEQLLGAQRERRIGQLYAKEASLKSQLEQTGSSLQSEVDQMLARELTELGIGAGEARREVGASLAARGLTGSSIQARYGADIATGELEEKAKLRGRTFGAKTAIETRKEELAKGLRQQREKIEQSADFSSMESASDLSFFLDTEQYRLDTVKMLGELEIDANSKSFLAQLLGGLSGNAAALFIGVL